MQLGTGAVPGWLLGLLIEAAGLAGGASWMAELLACDLWGFYRSQNGGVGMYWQLRAGCFKVVLCCRQWAGCTCFSTASHISS